MKRLMAAWSSTRERKTPRLRRRRASLAKKPSTALSQEPLAGCEQGGGSGGEVEAEGGMAAAPGLGLRMVVGGVVVDDGVDDLARRHLRLDGVEEADELLMAVALHAAPDDLALEDVE